MAVPATVHADVVTGPIKIKVIDYIFFPGTGFCMAAWVYNQ